MSYMLCAVFPRFSVDAGIPPEDATRGKCADVLGCVNSLSVALSSSAEPVTTS